jgi:hypothetical protein
LKNSSAGRCSIAFSISCTVLMEAKLSPSRASRNSAARVWLGLALQLRN